MARDVESLLLVMSADIRQLKRGMQEASGVFDREASRIEKRQKQLEREVEKIGEGIGKGIKKAQLAAGVAFGAIIAYATKTAAEAAELKNAFEVAFGAGTKGAEEFAKALATKVGRSQLDVMQSMTRFRLLFKNQTDDVALELTKGLQERAIDVGSLFNLKDADVVQKFFSGITGEAEPLKALGVTINEAALKTELLRLGFKGTVQQASENAKQIARYNIIMRETAVANGDAARTIDSTANRFKRLQGEVKDSAAKLGEQFLPIADKLLKWAIDALEAFNKLPEGMQLAGLAALGLVAASGPLTKLILGLQSIIKYALAARAAMLAIPAAGAAAGAATGAATAAGAAGGAAAGSLGLPAAATAAVLSLKGDTAPQRQKELTDQERLNGLLASEVQYRKRANEERAKGNERLARQFDELAQSSHSKAGGLKLKIDIANLPIGGPKGDGATSTELNTLKELGLSPDLLKPVGGTKGKGGSKADTASAQADRANQAIGRAEAQELAARQSLASTAETRAQAELDRLDIEEKTRAEDLRLAVKKKELTQPQADLVQAAEDRARTAEREVIIQQRDLALAEHRRAQETALERLAEEEISAKTSLITSAQGLADAELARLDRERDAYKKDLALDVLEGQKSQAEADALQAAYDRGDSARRAVILSERDERLAQELLNAKTADLDAQAQGLAIAASLADTAAERRDIELRLLDLQYQREKIELQAIIDSKKASDAEKAIAQKKLAQLDQDLPGQQEAVRRGTAGPAEQFARENSAGRLKETVEEIGVRSFNELADALAAAAGGAKDLGETAKNIFRQMLVDLLAAQIKKTGVDIIGRVAPGLLGKIPGFAGGTSYAPEGLAWVGEDGPELVRFRRPGAQVIPNATIRAAMNLKTPQAGGGHVTVLQPVHNNFAGAVMTKDLLREMEAVSRQHANVAAQRGAALALRGSPGALAAYQQHAGG